MARFAKIKLRGLTDKKLAQAISKKFGEGGGLASLSRQIKTYVTNQIAEAIGGKGLSGRTRAALVFQPHKQNASKELIGKLGVGKDGKINYEKLSNAWRHTLPKNSSDGIGLASVTGSFSIKGIRGGKLGTFEYSLDKDKLFDAKLATFGYLNRRFSGEDESGKSGLIIIPWLRHYIEGVQVDGYRFKRTAKNSRTGIGVMSKIKIPANAFEIPPLNIDPFGEIRDAIERRFRSKNFRDGFIAILKRAAKG